MALVWRSSGTGVHIFCTILMTMTFSHQKQCQNPCNEFQYVPCVELCSIPHTSSMLIMLLNSVDEEDEGGRPTKLSQFLKAASPNQRKTDGDLAARDSETRVRSDRDDRDKNHDRRDRENTATQQRLLALAQYTDNVSDIRDTSRHRHHKSSHQSKTKSSRSPGHRRH